MVSVYNSEREIFDSHKQSEERPHTQRTLTCPCILSGAGRIAAAHFAGRLRGRRRRLEGDGDDEGGRDGGGGVARAAPVFALRSSCSAVSGTCHGLGY